MSLSLVGRPDPSSERVPLRKPGAVIAALAVGATMMTTLGVAGVASAEGSWSSSLTNVANQFRTRNWTDRNSDAASTRTTASGCSRSDGATHRLNVELRKDNFGPDTGYGTKGFSTCNTTSVTQSWGDVAAGDYFNVVTHYDFGYASARSYGVGY